jgi:Dyp-type peroxidase family
MMEPSLEVDDIQGHVLVGFGGGHEIILGLRFRTGQVALGKTALLSCTDRITTARDSVRARGLRRSGIARVGPTPDMAKAGMAISFSCLGLQLMGPFAGPQDVFFRQGAFAAALSLNDEVDEKGLPVAWQVGGNADNTPHVLLVLAASSLAVVESAEASLTKLLSAPFEVIYRKYGRRLEGEREHFGFVDGISQPAPRGNVDGAPLIHREYATGHPFASDYARPGQPLVWPGQFLFGYPSQQTESDEPGADLSGGEQLLRNGSLLVFRQLRQNVSAFSAAMKKLAADFTLVGLPVNENMAAAWCVGRWPDGTPVSVSPQGPNDAISSDPYRRNGFLFRAKIDATDLTDRDGIVHLFPGSTNDRTGKSCPLFSHIRKVNPRDLAPDQGSIGVTLKSQMLRRGIPYGEEWSEETDQVDRGLLFLAYQTSIENQFHRLMTLWVNNPSAPHGQGIDPIIGAPQEGRLLTRMPADNNNYKATLPGRWVTAVGAGYFFAPGIKALKAILIQ